MRYYQIIGFCLLLFFSSCEFLTEKFCGSLPQVEQGMLDLAKKKYGEAFSINPIPCENLYLNVQLKEELNDTVLLSSLHKQLYDVKNKRGWQDLVVHDMKGNYLFTHAYTGKTFKATTGY